MIAEDLTSLKVISREKIWRSNQQEAIWEAMFAHATLGIIVVNQQGEMVLVNQLAGEQFGYSKEELIGSDAKMLYQDIQDRERHIDILLTKGFVRNRKLALQRKEVIPCSCGGASEGCGGCGGGYGGGCGFAAISLPIPEEK